MFGRLRKICVVLTICLVCLPVLCAWADGGPDVKIMMDKKEKFLSSSCYVVYPVMKARDQALESVARRMNEVIQEALPIEECLRRLDAVPQGGSLVVKYRAEGRGYYAGWGYLSLLFSAEEKLPSGDSSRVYYPLMLDGKTGERVTFEQVFADPEGARNYIERYAKENGLSFPESWEDFAFSEKGKITFYDLVGGTSGAISFRYSELWDFLDTAEDGVARSMLRRDLYGVEAYVPPYDPAAVWEMIRAQSPVWPGVDGSMPGLSDAARFAYGRVAIAAEEEYPTGVCLRAENPQERGYLILMDEEKTCVNGVLMEWVDTYGCLITGKTTLQAAIDLLGAPDERLPVDAESAKMYRVCPGTAVVYRYQPDFPLSVGETEKRAYTVSIALYADEDGVVQYVKLAMEDIR